MTPGEQAGLELLREGYKLLTLADVPEERQFYFLKRGYGYSERVDKRTARKLIARSDIVEQRRGRWLVYTLEENTHG